MEISVAGHIKRLIQHSAVYGIGHIVTRSLGFLLLPLYTNTISPDDYGKAALLFSFLAIMNVIYGYGMDVAFLRYVALQDDKQQQRILFSTGFISLLLSSVLFSLVFFAFQRPVTGLIFHSAVDTNLILLCAGVLFFDTIGLLPFMVLRAKEKSVPFTLLKLANVILNVAANVIFIIVLKLGVAGIFWANLVSSALISLFLIPIITKFFIFHFDRVIFRELIQFGLPYIPSGLAVVAMDLIDRFILERLTDLETTGIYSAGYKLGMFMALFIAAFRFAWHPFFLSTSRQPNAKQVFARVLTYFVLACSAVFLLVSLFIDELVRFHIFGFTLFGESYWSSTRIVPLILISYIFYGIYVNFLVGVYLLKKTAMLVWVTGISAVVNIAANFILIPYFGMLGSAWATVLSYMIMAALLYLSIFRWYPVAYEWGRITKIALTALILFLGQLYIIQTQFWWLKLGMFLLFWLILFVVGFLDRTEKTRLQQLIRRRKANAR